LKLGRPDWSTRDLVIRDWNRVGLKKKQEKKKPGATRRPDWPGKTRLRPSCKPADFCFFCFFTKTTSFWFKKKTELTRPTGDPVKTWNLDLRPSRVLKLCIWALKNNNIKSSISLSTISFDVQLNCTGLIS